MHIGLHNSVISNKQSNTESSLWIIGMGAREMQSAVEF